MLTFGLPPDAMAWGALICAALVFFLPRPRARVGLQLTAVACAACLLSCTYFFVYLDGGPRIIDATAYLLEARSLAQGSFSFDAPDPTGSFRGRFLIHTANDAHRLASIFPPGYPLLLAGGVLLGVHHLIGPLLAVGLTLSTYFLTHELTGRRRDALAAAVFSAICACLRYHTAETMSHGLSALLAALTLALTIRLGRREHSRDAIVLGLGLGFLIATRQLTGAVLGLSAALTLLIQRGRKGLSSFAWIGVGALPGITLLLAHQHAVTGDFFTSAQTRYYALADGPPGCFGLGLGKGCHYEHADVVAKHGGGLNLKWMGLNTLHRFHFHAMDVAHFEPLLLVPLALLWQAQKLSERKKRQLTAPVLTLVTLPSAYALFYFAGSYPGGGARFFSELLPIWHALLAWGLCRLRLFRLGLALSLFGFAIHAAYSHNLLSSPSFGPRTRHVESIETLLEREGKNDSSLPVVFFETAHEFNVAVLSSDRFVAARRTRDAREIQVVKQSQATHAFTYSSKTGLPTLSAWESPEEEQSFELEFEFPALAQRDLWVHPEHVPHNCISRGRALKLHPLGGSLELTLGTPVPAHTAVVLTGLSREGFCLETQLPAIDVFRPHLVLRNETLSKFSHIDRLTLTPTHP